MSGPILIVFISPDGEEREERWPSIAAFRAWAISFGLTLSYTAYQEDEDGEFAVVEKGRIVGG